MSDILGSLELLRYSQDTALESRQVDLLLGIAARVELLERTERLRELGVQGDDVVAANTVTLGNGNYFSLTGSTAVHYLTITGWTAGSVVYLKTVDGLTFHHLQGSPASTSAELRLNGSTDWTAGAGALLTLLYDGTDWLEVSRFAP